MLKFLWQAFKTECSKIYPLFDHDKFRCKCNRLKITLDMHAYDRNCITLVENIFQTSKYNTSITMD